MRRQEDRHVETSKTAFHVRHLKMPNNWRAGPNVQGQPEQTNDMEGKGQPQKYSLKQLIINILLLGLLTVVSCLLLIQIQIKPLTDWVIYSSNPQLTIPLGGLGCACFIWSLFRLIKEINLIFVIIVIPESLKAYFSAIPVLIPIAIFIISFSLLMFVFPNCEPPQLEFEVTSPGIAPIHSDNAEVELPVSSSFTVTAKSKSPFGSIIFCSWENSGDIFASVAKTPSCVITGTLNDQPGPGILTVKTSAGFCQSRSIKMLGIESHLSAP